MARLLGPDPSMRTVWRVVNGECRSAPGASAVVYADAQGSIPADIRSYDPLNPTTVGAAIAGSTVTVAFDSTVPLFWFPDGVDTVWVSVTGGPLTEVPARFDNRIDTLAATVAALPSTSAGTAAGLAIVFGGI